MIKLNALKRKLREQSFFTQRNHMHIEDHARVVPFQLYLSALMNSSSLSLAGGDILVRDHLMEAAMNYHPVFAARLVQMRKTGQIIIIK